MYRYEAIILTVSKPIEEVAMQALMKFMFRLERLLVAATFAEAGCWKTARWVMDEEKRYAQQRPRSRVSVSTNQRPFLRI
jgi:hypothetical protein